MWKDEIYYRGCIMLEEWIRRNNEKWPGWFCKFTFMEWIFILIILLCAFSKSIVELIEVFYV